MKKLLIILFALGLGFGASAQYHGGIGRGSIARPRIIIGGYLPISPYLGFGYGSGLGYSPYYGYPPAYGFGYGNRSRPTKLDRQIDDIKNDYSDRISSAKHDDALPRKERKAKVKELKHERDGAIDNLKRNYYKTKPTNYSS